MILTLQCSFLGLHLVMLSVSSSVATSAYFKKDVRPVSVLIMVAILTFPFFFFFPPGGSHDSSSPLRPAWLRLLHMLVTG